MRSPSLVAPPLSRFDNAPLASSVMHRRSSSGRADRHHPPTREPLKKGTDNAPTSGKHHQKPLERAHATDPLANQTFADGSSTSRSTSVRAGTDLEDGRGSLSSAHHQGIIVLPHSDTSVRYGREQRRKITGERTPPPPPVAATPPAPHLRQRHNRHHHHHPQPRHHPPPQRPKNGKR